MAERTLRQLLRRRAASFDEAGVLGQIGTVDAGSWRDRWCPCARRRTGSTVEELYVGRSPRFARSQLGSALSVAAPGHDVLV